MLSQANPLGGWSRPSSFWLTPSAGNSFFVMMWRIFARCCCDIGCAGCRAKIGGILDNRGAPCAAQTNEPPTANDRQLPPQPQPEPPLAIVVAAMALCCG